MGRATFRQLPPYLAKMGMGTRRGKMVEKLIMCVEPMLTLLACQLLKPTHDVSPFKFCFEIGKLSDHYNGDAGGGGRRRRRIGKSRRGGGGWDLCPILSFLLA